MTKEDFNVWENGKLKRSLETGTTDTQNTGSLDIDLRRVFSVWPYILLFGLLGYLAGLTFLRYSESVYNVTTSLSIEENQEVKIGQALFGNPRDPFNDKIAFFKSPSLAALIVDTLGLQYHAQAQGRFKNKDFYGIIQWFIIRSDPASEVPDINFTIMPDKNGFRFRADSLEMPAKWGIPFTVRGETVIVRKLDDFVTQTPIYCFNRNKLQAAFSLSRKLAIATSKESNIITVSYSDVSSERAIDILNTLVNLNIDILENDKSRTYSQAIRFIEQRMTPLARELDSIENSLASYKASTGMSSLSASSDIYLNRIQEYDKQLTEINILKETIDRLESFIKNPTLRETDLSFVGITNNPNLQATLQSYQQMLQQREKLALTATENNPSLKLLDQNLEDMRSNMNQQVANYRSNLAIAEATYNAKSREAGAFLRNVPVKEKVIIDKTRLQNIKEALYLTLLQRREEASIARASVTVNSKLLYPPAKMNSTILPSKWKILAGFSIFGLILPLLYAIIKEVLNRKIISKKQLQSVTTIPVIAELAQAENPGKAPFVIEGTHRSMFAEQIRSLRTNINFYTPGQSGTNFILITSSVSGEGKSFLSMNLAKSYAMQGKRVALLEFDLRRPKIAKALGLSNDKTGLSSVLIGKVLPGEICHSIGEGSEHLDFYPAGAIPPNPQELISGNFIGTIKEHLEANYDVVIIDTPPFGIVADAQILGQWADVTLIVTRFQQTVKEQVNEINEWQARKIFKSIALVFNGVRNKGYFGNKYGYYYYKSKYGYSYYSGTEKAGKNKA